MGWLTISHVCDVRAHRPDEAAKDETYHRSRWMVLSRTEVVNVQAVWSDAVGNVIMSHKIIRSNKAACLACSTRVCDDGLSGRAVLFDERGIPAYCVLILTVRSDFTCACLTVSLLRPVAARRFARQYGRLSVRVLQRRVHVCRARLVLRVGGPQPARHAFGRF